MNHPIGPITPLPSEPGRLPIPTCEASTASSTAVPKAGRLLPRAEKDRNEPERAAGPRVS